MNLQLDSHGRLPKVRLRCESADSVVNQSTKGKKELNSLLFSIPRFRQQLLVYFVGDGFAQLVVEFFVGQGLFDHLFDLLGVSFPLMEQHADAADGRLAVRFAQAQLRVLENEPVVLGNELFLRLILIGPAPLFQNQAQQGSGQALLRFIGGIGGGPG